MEQKEERGGEKPGLERGKARQEISPQSSSREVQGKNRPLCPPPPVSEPSFDPFREIVFALALESTFANLKYMGEHWPSTKFAPYQGIHDALIREHLRQTHSVRPPVSRPT